MKNILKKKMNFFNFFVDKRKRKCDYMRIIKGGGCPLWIKIINSTRRGRGESPPFLKMDINKFAVAIEKNNAALRELKVYRALQHEILWGGAQHIELKLTQRNNCVVSCDFNDLKHNCALEEHALVRGGVARKLLTDLLFFANIGFNLSNKTFKLNELNQILFGLKMYCKGKFGVYPPLYKLESLIKSF